MSGVLFAVILVTAVGCGMVAGIFFAFSSFIMPALRRVNPVHGIASMQSINLLAVTPAFMTLLFGTAAACLGLAVWTLFLSADQFNAWLLAGVALYIVGSIGITIARNVPLNDRLASIDPRSATSTDVWQEYVARWTAWNHVRAVAALAASTVFIIALGT